MKDEQITMGSARTYPTQQVGDLHCIKCNQFGEELGRIHLGEVSLNKDSAFNLLSITQMTHKHGWKVSMDDTALILYKGKTQVTFDIVIATPKGAVYCGYFK